VSALPAPPFDSPPVAVEPSGRVLRGRLRRAGLSLAGHLYARPQARPALQSLLLIRPDHLGDLLFLTPALHVLRRALPAARITLLAGPWGAEAVRHNADLDDVLLLPFPGFERRPKGNAWAPYRLLREQARRLRGASYDTAVVLRFDHWWGAWLAAAAGIPCRIGYDLPDTRPFLTRRVPYQPGRHEVLQNAGLLAALVGGPAEAPGPTRYFVTERDQAHIAGWLAGQGIGADQCIAAIHPGAGAAVKQWPAADWAIIAERLTQAGLRVVLTGGEGERGLTAAVAAAADVPVIDAAGQTTLGQLAALYRRCALVLGSDSGPLHLAVAVDTPTVHLYGPVPATKFGPWGDPTWHVVLTSPFPCVPCDRLDWPIAALPQHQCMVAIRPEAVWAAAEALLK
jgi:ADP-heptose:LPS heptosyltransferase